MESQEWKAIQLEGSIPETKVGDWIRTFIRIARSHVLSNGMDFEIVVSLPESPEGGGMMTRPHDRGGPQVFIRIASPEQYKDTLELIMEQCIKELE